MHKLDEYIPTLGSFDLNAEKEIPCNKSKVTNITKLESLYSKMQYKKLQVAFFGVHYSYLKQG
jgi:hypothetical protein